MMPSKGANPSLLPTGALGPQGKGVPCSKQAAGRNLPQMEIDETKRDERGRDQRRRKREKLETDREGGR